MKKNLSFAGILLISLIVRLLIAPLQGFKFDVDSWGYWANRLNDLPFSSFYSKDVFSDYTPGYLYILWLLGFIKNLFNLDTNAFFYLLKVPAIISEILIGFFVYQILIKNLNSTTLSLIITGILFNLGFIFNSSVWGQVDGVLTLLMMLTIYLLQQKKLILSSIFLGLAFITKPHTIALFPIFFLYLLKHHSLKSFLQLSLPAFIISTLLAFPFFPTNPIGGLLNRVFDTAAQYPYNSLNAQNFWGIFGFWINDETQFLGLSYRIWGYILYGSYWLLLGYLYLKRKLPLYALASLACLAFYFLPTKVHERYIYPTFVFLVLAYPLIKQKIYLWIFQGFNLIHLLSLYYVYIYYNVFYHNISSPIYNEALYQLIEGSNKSLSVINTILFIIITYIIAKYARVEES